MINTNRKLFIEITTREVRFLLCDKRRRNKKLNLTFDSVPYAFNSQDMSDLTEILKSYRLKNLTGAKVPVFLLIPFQNGLLREFKLPWMDKKVRSSTINYYLQHEIPGLTSELIYTYHVVEEHENKYLTVKVLVARKDLIDFYIKNVEEAGYQLLGIEFSISALAELFSDIPAKTVLYFHNIKDKRIQIVLYKDAKPEAVSEVTIEQLDITKYQIYLGLDEYSIPVDFIVTDLHEQTEELASVLLEAGLAKERLLTFNKNIVENNPDLGQRFEAFSAYSLLAELYRVEENKNLNFYPRFQRVFKVRALILSVFCVLATFLLLTIMIWYPKYNYLKTLEQELSSVQDYHADLLDDEIIIAQSEWKIKQQSKAAILEKIQFFIKNVEKEISLNRLSLSNNTMYIWAECANEAAITNTIAILEKNGWKDPVLIDYYFDNQKLVFCLSVEGSW